MLSFAIYLKFANLCTILCHKSSIICILCLKICSSLIYSCFINDTTTCGRVISPWIRFRHVFKLRRQKAVDIEKMSIFCRFSYQCWSVESIPTASKSNSWKRLNLPTSKTIITSLYYSRFYFCANKIAFSVQYTIVYTFTVWKIS